MAIRLPAHHLSIDPSEDWVPDPVAPGTEHLGLYLRSSEFGVYLNVREHVGGRTRPPRTASVRCSESKTGDQPSTNGPHRPAISSSSAVRSKRREWVVRSSSKCSSPTVGASQTLPALAPGRSSPRYGRPHSDWLQPCDSSELFDVASPWRARNRTYTSLKNRSTPTMTGADLGETRMSKAC